MSPRLLTCLAVLLLAACGDDPAIPGRYRSAAGTGVSDHWPLIATIQFAKKQ